MDGGDFTKVPALPEHMQAVKSKKKKKKKKNQHVKELASNIAGQIDRASEKYKRGQRLKVKGVSDKKLKAKLKDTEKAALKAAVAAARAEILLPESTGYLEAEDATEKTYKFTQKDIAKHVDHNTASKQFSLKLTDFAPYRVDYSKNGRYMAIAGAKGHISLLDSLRNTPLCEVYANETVRDIKVLHNHTMFAVAQRKNIFIYDDEGIEIHRLKSHIAAERMEFLPYHFLLASVGQGGWLKYQDTSTGQLVSEHRTKLGACNTMCQNPWNAIIHLGHANGTVTLWSPSVSQPLVKMLCHKGPVSSLAIDRSGKHLVTAGLDGKVSVWDVRTYRKLHSYFAYKPPKSMDISQTGLLAVSSGYQVHVWKDALKQKAQSPYMRHELPGEEISNLKFRPYEDVLGVGSTTGCSAIIVPGAGEANFDAFEANPFENKKQRQEAEVHGLLEKLQPDMIVLNPDSIGTIKGPVVEEENADLLEGVSVANRRDGAKQERNKMRGKSKYGKKMKRKHRNIIDEERMRMRNKLEEREKKKQQELNGSTLNSEDPLSRFNPKRKRF